MTYLPQETKPVIVERSAAVLPATTQTPYFTVTGRVLITQIVGAVSSITVVNGIVTAIS